MRKETTKERNVLSPELKERIDKALSYLSSTDFSSLSDGTYFIEDENIYAMIQSFHVSDPIDVEFETHKKYLDIQYVLSGILEIKVTERNLLIPCTEYDQENDVIFYKRVESDTHLRLYPGEYAILFPTDAHRMVCFPKDGQPADIRKVVVKVLVGGSEK